MGSRRTRYIIGGCVLALIIILALGIGLGLGLRKKSSSPAAPAPTVSPPPTAPPDSEGPYKRAAIASDAGPCSEIGKDILAMNGSAVDITIATMFCVGVLNMHSCGIGGGGFMLVYERATQETKVIDFREVAPGRATRDMYVGELNRNKALFGALAAAVPGAVKGYFTAWKLYGRLPWKMLLQPAIDKAKHGFQIGIPLYETMNLEKENLEKDEGLRQLLMDEDGNLKKLGEEITNPELAATLERIRDDPYTFYNGTLAKDIAKDMEEHEGIISLQDLENYQVQIDKAAVENKMGTLTWYTTPPPTSGVVITLILNIMKGYNLSEAALADDASTSLTYHRIVEAFKFAFARRALLGDPKFVNISEIAKNLTDPTFAEELRKLILDNQTHPNFTFYGKRLSRDDHGTAHLSVLAPNGDAVSVTSTINYRLGGKFRSTKTGIVYNNEMDDFSIPGSVNLYGIAPSRENFIEPGKRPMSSICPVIFTDKNGDVVFVGGAAGGPRIITSVALVVMKKLWFERTLSEAVEEPRFHHQLLPPHIMIEKKKPYILSKAVQKGLLARGHQIKPGGPSIVQAISVEKDGKIFGKSDPRKHGWAAGF